MKHVLIVDDDYDICEALQLILEGRYRVSVAYNGFEALTLLEERNVDAVVLDLMMPVMDGEALLKEMCARGLNIPVVIASAAMHLATRARAAGAAAFVQKPFEAEELEEALRQIFGPGGDGGSSHGGGGGFSPPPGHDRSGSPSARAHLGGRTFAQPRSANTSAPSAGASSTASSRQLRGDAKLSVNPTPIRLGTRTALSAGFA